MVIYIVIILEELKSLGKKYPWVTPEFCPVCILSPLWGHGYVPRYFNDDPEPYWIKRWYCPHCKSVHTARPASHYRRFQQSRWIMLGFLFLFFLLEKFPRKHTRQKEQYWIKGFLFQASRKTNLKSISKGFLTLLKSKVIPFTHSAEYYAITSVKQGTYLSFAVTGRSGFL